MGKGTDLGSVKGRRDGYDQNYIVHMYESLKELCILNDRFLIVLEGLGYIYSNVYSMYVSYICIHIYVCVHT